MGGHALKKTAIARFDRNTYERAKINIVDALSSHLDIRFLLDVPGKETFGDLDVLYKARHAGVAIRALIDQTFHPVEVYHNGPILSFAYLMDDNHYQVDMILVDEFDSYMFYLSYSDVGNIIGRILKGHSLHFGMQGLFVRVNIGSQEKVLILSKRPEEICRYLGVDYEVWQHFSSMPEIFNWIVSMNAFVPLVDYGDKDKADRQMYQQFLHYIAFDGEPEPYIRPSKVQEAIEHFNKQEEVDAMKAEYALGCARREKFNGNKFIEYYSDKVELGKAILRFKTEVVAQSDVLSFDSWIDMSTVEQVDECIARFAKTGHL